MTDPTIQLGKLVQLDARSIWKHEAHDFTPWLLEHADHLSEVLGIDIELNAAEHPVGNFALDLLGRDLTNGCVLIVENQLTATDHGHLGQLLTYAAGTDAGTIIWMAPEFREEHRQAIDWLNQATGEEARFFGIEIGAVRIGDSLPAPLFKLKAQPNDWHSQVSSAAKSGSQGSGKGAAYRAFWAAFLERVHVEHPDWTNARKPTDGNWMSMPGPIKGTSYGVNFALGGKTRVELYIDAGDESANKSMFDRLLSERMEIERAFGGPLSWEELPGRRACRIAAYGEGDASNIEAHNAYIDWFFETGVKLRSALAGATKIITASL
jgi:hypothetical protein